MLVFEPIVHLVFETKYLVLKGYLELHRVCLQQQLIWINIS